MGRLTKRMFVFAAYVARQFGRLAVAAIEAGRVG